MRQLVNLDTFALEGDPTDTLPEPLNGASGDGLLDLSWMPEEYGFAGKGLWPVEPKTEAHDPATHTTSADIVDRKVVKSRKVVVVTYAARPLTEAELPPPPPPPTPRALGRMEFLDLCQAVGGMSDADLVAADADERLKALWIKLNLASVVERDHPSTLPALHALASFGYLPNGATAVIEAWPVT